jgi:PKD repeat protein
LLTLCRFARSFRKRLDRTGLGLQALSCQPLAEWNLQSLSGTTEDHYDLCDFNFIIDTTTYNVWRVISIMWENKMQKLSRVLFIGIVGLILSSCSKNSQNSPLGNQGGNGAPVSPGNVVLATPASGPVPLSVSFVFTGSSPVSYLWSFGDGTTSDLKNPTHIYSTVGSYTATVTVTDSGGGTSQASTVITTTAVSGTGNTYWVSNSGKDSNSGSQTSPWLTLQHGANKLSPGDTLNVQPGTYAGFSVGYSTSATAGTPTNPITVQGAPGTTPSAVVITSQNPDRADAIDLEPGTDYWTISGFSILNSNGQFTQEGILINANYVNVLNNTINGDGNSMSFCILTSGSYLTIQGNTCSKTTGTGLIGHGIYVGNASTGANITHVNISGNTIFSTSEHGLQVNGVGEAGTEEATNITIQGNTIYNVAAGSGMNLDTLEDSVVSNNLIYNYKAYGIVLFADNSASTNDLIVNNTIYSSATGVYSALGIFSAGSGSINNTVLNNILLGAGSYGTAIAIDSLALSGFTSNYNVVGTSTSEATFSIDDGNSSETWASWKSGTGQDANSIVGSLAALFVNSSSNNYQEAAGSPSIGAGTSTDAPAIDILGNPRPTGALYDIGCYQH